MAPSLPETTWSAQSLLAHVEGMVADEAEDISLSKLDSFTRLALACKALAFRPMSASLPFDGLTVGQIDEFVGPSPDLPDLQQVLASNALESKRIFLRAPESTDVDVIYRVVNDPSVSWRLPTRGKYVGPEALLDSLVNESSQLVVACERTSGRPVTLLGLSDISERNSVGELSFFSLRNSTDSFASASSEALACFVSHCFWDLGLRKLTGAIPESSFNQFRALEGFLFETEGVQRRQVAVGNRYEDLYLISVWKETWLQIEPALRIAFENWQV